MDYTTKADVQSYLTTNIDASFDAALDMHIEAISRYMDEEAGITLVTNTLSTKKYDGSGLRFLDIDPVRGITTITLDGNEVTPYQYPANTDSKHTLLFEKDYWPKGYQNIEVTGYHARFSGTTIPADIKFAATVLVALLIQGIREKNQGVKSETVGKYSVSYKDDQQRADLAMAKEIINKYRRFVC